jgi:hypothetical protein
MKNAVPITDIEEESKFDRVLVERLAKIVEILQNIED